MRLKQVCIIVLDATKMNIEIEESRCECGYLLFHLNASTCPECGRDVEDQVGWTDHCGTPLSESKSAVTDDLPGVD